MMTPSYSDSPPFGTSSAGFVSDAHATSGVHGGSNASGAVASNVSQLDGLTCPQHLYGSCSRVFFTYLDRTTLYPKSRWTVLLFLVCLFSFRIYMTQGFYIVTYALAIYLLNLFLGFLTPQEDYDSEDFVLPVRDSEEYRPFQRRLPEFKFWKHATKAVLFSIIATLFPFLDLPVFWPVLFVYFIMLFFMTMKQQIKHMIKYKYVPFSWGKQTYGDITRSHPSLKPGAPYQGVYKKPNAFGKKNAVSFPSLHSKSVAHLSAAASNDVPRDPVTTFSHNSPTALECIENQWDEAEPPLPYINQFTQFRDAVLGGNIPQQSDATTWRNWMAATAVLDGFFTAEGESHKTMLENLSSDLNNIQQTYAQEGPPPLQDQDLVASLAHATQSIDAVAYAKAEKDILQECITSLEARFIGTLPASPRPSSKPIK